MTINFVLKLKVVHVRIGMSFFSLVTPVAIKKSAVKIMLFAVRDAV